MSKYEETFQKRLGELKAFIEKTGKKPTIKTDKSLYRFIIANTRGGDDLTKQKLSQKERVLSLLDEMNATIETRRLSSWDDKLAKLKKYLEENGKLPSAKDSDEKLDFVVRNWIGKCEKNEELKTKLHAMFDEVGFVYVKQENNARLCSFKDVFKFAFNACLRPSLLKHVVSDGVSYETWFGSTKRNHSNSPLSKESMEELGKDSIDSMFSEKNFFDMGLLRKFDEINTTVDFELTGKAFIVMTKPSGSNDVQFTVTEKKPKSNKSVINVNDWTDSEIVISENICRVVNSLRDELKKLSFDDSVVLQKYLMMNPNLSVNEKKIKKILSKKLGKPYILASSEKEIFDIWSKSIDRYAEEKPRLNKNLLESMKKLDLNMAAVAEEFGQSRERIRQLSAEIFKIFEMTIEEWGSFEVNDLDKVKITKSELNPNKFDPSTIVKNFEPVMKLSLGGKLRTSHLKNIRVGQTPYTEWVYKTLRDKRNGVVSNSKTILPLDELEMMSDEISFDIELLKIYDRINESFDLELKNDVFLKMTKPSGSNQMVYEIVSEKESLKEREFLIKTPEDFIDVSFVIYENMKTILNRVQTNAQHLKGEDIRFYRGKYEAIDLGLSKMKSNFKNALVPHHNKPFSLKNAESKYKTVWNSVLDDLQGSRISPEILSGLKDVEVNLSTVARNSGVSRERVRQVFNQAFDEFESKLDEIEFNY